MIIYRITKLNLSQVCKTALTFKNNNKIHYKSKLKKNHKTISIHADTKAFANIKHSFMIKTLSKQGK